MRTRSQPDSPGGFVSLDDMKNGTRRTRSTRSASRAASQEPTTQGSSSQQSSSEQPTESATQPATRSKTQKRTVKKTTTRKTTSTASSSKPQTRATKRSTRSSKRKADEATAEEAQEHVDENSLDTARANDENNAEANIEEPASTSDNALLVPKNSELNRKRSRTETSDDNAEPVTPYANKRRNLGPPGSTPFARHLTPLARRLSRTAPRSERMLRRRAESQGRIHSTIFRLPQFVAQTEADRLASKTSLTPPSAEPLQPDLDTSSEQAQTDDEVVTKQPAAAEQPSTPEPAKSGWNISGIFSSVPRSFSRFLPRFGRSPARSEVPAIQQPASERIQRTRPSEASSATASEAETQSRRRSTDERPAKRARNLSFSLYPAKIDRSLYLGDVNKSTSQPAGLPPAPAPASQPVQQTSPQKTVSETSITPSEQHDDRTSRASGIASESQKKRKRSPSPDVIPNPAGSSYGMDLDYFCYSSESEDDEVTPPVPQTEPGKKAVHGKSALRDTAQTEKPVERKQKKNVHFGASPEDTPTKLRRARATDPYNGTHFIGMGGLQSASAPTTPTPASRAQDVRQRPGFAPNRSGTFELDYDAFADDSDSSGAPSPSSVPAPSPIAKTPTPAQPATPQSAPSPAPRSAARPTQATSTPARPDDDPAVAKARARIQKHAPQTPSRLRESSRYSSPIVPPDTPDITPNLTSAAAIEKVSEEFGDDQFAQEAQWLFENCPSGDFDSLKWPQPKPFGEGLNVSAEAIRIVNEIWDPADTDKAHAIFQHEFAEFKKTLT